jgi:hypothetical protein
MSLKYKGGRHRARNFECKECQKILKRQSCREKNLTDLSGAQPQRLVQLLRWVRATVTPAQQQAPFQDARMQIMRDELNLMIFAMLAYRQSNQ